MWLSIPSNLGGESKFSNDKNLGILEMSTMSFITVASQPLSLSCLPCRIMGFRLSLGILALLTVLGALGIANSFLDEYLDLNVAKKLRHF